MAVLSGIAGPEKYNAIWKSVLSQVGHIKYNPYIISPYYNYYVISAMAMMGHRSIQTVLRYFQTGAYRSKSGCPVTSRRPPSDSRFDR